jgi:hypothetical protein
MAAVVRHVFAERSKHSKHCNRHQSSGRNSTLELEQYSILLYTICELCLAYRYHMGSRNQCAERLPTKSGNEAHSQKCEVYGHPTYNIRVFRDNRDLRVYMFRHSMVRKVQVFVVLERH